MAEKQFAALSVRLKNRRPVDVANFTTALAAIDAQYRKHIQAKKLALEGAEYKLYIRAFRNRSIEAELFSSALQGAMLAANHWEAIVSFSERIKSIYEFFLGLNSDDPKISKQDMQQIADTLSVTANDHGANFIINAKNLNVTIPVIAINSDQANTIQNQIRRALSKTPPISDDVYRQETMTLYQARGGTIGSKMGHSAIIERFSERPRKLLFADEEVERQILHNDDSPPFDSVFIVDVRVGLVGDAPDNYLITRVRESYPKS